MSNNNAGSSVIRLVLAQRVCLDGAAYAALLRGWPEFQLVGSTTSLTELVTWCQERSPATAVIDAKYPEDAAFHAAADLINNGYVKGVLLLDDRDPLPYINQTSSIPQIGYCTRQSTAEHLRKLLVQLNGGEAVLEVSLRTSLHATNSNGERLRFDSPLSDLTPREKEIMKLLAEGFSVREAADQLQLAPSTVDNHKSRLKKKLGVHKAAELTRLAMRIGLIR